MVLLLLVMACSGGADGTAAPAAAGSVPTGSVPAGASSSSSAASSPVLAPLEQPKGPPAPTKSLAGLTIGTSDDAAIQAWITARSLTCTASPSVRRTTFRYLCRDGLTVAGLPGLLDGRTIHGVLAELLLVRGDTSPLSHISTIRKYSLPADAETDYRTTIAALTTTLGTPTRSSAADVAKMTGKLAYFSSRWTFSDLDVQLRLMRVGADFFSVSESWDLPGAEQSEAARSGGGHP